MTRDPAETAALPLAGAVVAELGGRVAVGAAGSLLAQLGATVVVVEPAEPPPDPLLKWAQRDLFAAGKHSLVRSGDADTAVAALLDAADVVLTSRDVDGAPPPRSNAIVCDITACGTSGPLAGQALSDPDIQALCGITDTTGASDGPPTAIGVPIMELSAALYSAAAIVAALRAGVPQTIEVALYDCAINALTTFLPAHFSGGRPTRVGNWHPLLGPWNVYRARDGWLLICTASEPQWRRLTTLIGQPALADALEYRTTPDRTARRPELDRLIEAWTSPRALDDCLAAVSDAGIPCGPILRIADLPVEPNLAHRGMVHRVATPDGRTLLVPGSPFRTSAWSGRAPTQIPSRDSDRARLPALLAARRRAAPAVGPGAPPLAGLKVVEIGAYTTAPLAARYLAGFGADVVRIEPPGGEPARSWQGQDGRGYFFVMANSGKRAVALDLATPDGKAALTSLLGDADVLLENLKPGALARLGFDAAQLAALNPRLVYCAISGFGVDSAYPERPAFDAVVQAMSGLMDVTRSGGTPYKAGISAADIGGGQFALLAILAALVQRDRSRRGQTIDLSMQDGAAWSTQTAWNRPDTADADTPAPRMPARPIAEAVAHPQTVARALLVERRDRAGFMWQLHGAPMRLSATPIALGEPAGPLLDWATLRAQVAPAG